MKYRCRSEPTSKSPVLMAIIKSEKESIKNGDI